MRNIIKIFLLLLLFQNSALARYKSRSVSDNNFIIAKINNKAITNLELQDRYRFVVKIAKIKIGNKSEQKLLQSQIIDKMIDEELIRQEAQRLEITTNADEIRNAIDIAALRQKKNATQFKLFLRRHGLSFDNYISQVESDILWSKIIRHILRPKVNVTEVEIREFFEQQKYDISVRKFLISEILISNTGNMAKNSQDLAQKLLEELQEGANFENIVEQFSSGFSAENNGKIGWVDQGDIDPKIYNAITKLTKNSYSNPLLLSDGYHIFKLLDAKTESKINDKDYKKARNIITMRKLQVVANGYLMDLRKNAFVEIDF